MLPPAPVLTLMQSEAVPFSAGTCRQLYGGVCLIALWGTEISDHHLFGMGISDCHIGLDVV